LKVLRFKFSAIAWIKFTRKFMNNHPLSCKFDLNKAISFIYPVPFSQKQVEGINDAYYATMGYMTLKQAYA